MCFVNIVSSSIARLFIFLMVFFSVMSFYFDEVRLSVFSFIDYGFGVVAKKSLPNPKSQRFFPLFLSYSFLVLGFTFKSMIHFELYLDMVQSTDENLF